MSPEDLERLVTLEMPFGKYKGRVIADLPGNYLTWFAREGFPKGEIGRLLAQSNTEEADEHRRRLAAQREDVRSLEAELRDTESQLNDQLLRLAHALVVRGHLHAGSRRTAARRGKHPLALDLNHAGAAVPYCLHSRLVAETRYLDAETICDLDEGFVGRGGNLTAIEHERDGGGVGKVAHLAGDGVHGFSKSVRWESI